MRGRVMALYMMIFIGGTPLGSPLIGWVGEAYGARWTLIAGGALTVLGTALASTLYLRRRRVLTPDPRPSNLFPRVWDNQTVARAQNVSD
jgi:MFS family permease